MCVGSLAIFDWIRRTQCNLLFDYKIMNYYNNLYILCTASMSLEKRARVDSCQRTIIVFECNNFTRNNNNNKKIIIMIVVIIAIRPPTTNYTTRCVWIVYAPYLLHYTDKTCRNFLLYTSFSRLVFLFFCMSVVPSFRTFIY